MVVFLRLQGMNTVSGPGTAEGADTPAAAPPADALAGANESAGQTEAAAAQSNKKRCSKLVLKYHLLLLLLGFIALVTLWPEPGAAFLFPLSRPLFLPYSSEPPSHSPLSLQARAFPRPT